MKITINIDTKDIIEIKETISFLGSLLPVETEKVHSVTETVSEAPKKEKTTQSKGTTKKEPESAPTKDERKVDVTLETVKAVAQLKVRETDKDTVKNIINKYAPKLAEVKESDYEALYKDLQGLGV